MSMDVETIDRLQSLFFGVAIAIVALYCWNWIKLPKVCN